MKLPLDLNAAARRISFARAYVQALAENPCLYQMIWRSTRTRPEAPVAEFLIPQTIPKFAGAPLAALDPDDLRYILRHARRDRLLAAAVERELHRRIPRLRPRRAPARRA